MRVVFTAEAQRSLDAIAGYIAGDNPDRAASFREELSQKAFGLADMPYAFPLVPSRARQGVRRRVHGNYVILYVPREQYVLILNFIHSARDYRRFVRKSGN